MVSALLASGYKLARGVTGDFGVQALTQNNIPHLIARGYEAVVLHDMQIIYLRRGLRGGMMANAMFGESASDSEVRRRMLQ